MGPEIEQTGILDPIPEQLIQPDYSAGSQVIDYEQNPQKKKKRVFIIFILAAVVVCVLFIFKYQVFTIRNLKVIGIRTVSLKDVAKAAGLDRDLFYFTLNEESIRTGVNSNRYLIFDRMEKVFPNTLILHVQERVPSAFFTYIGIGYVMASDGVILERTRDLSRGQGMLTVSGLDVWGDLREGLIPFSSKTNQITSCIAILHELTDQGFLNQIGNINMYSPMNVYLTTLDAYTIHLGDTESLRAKIGTIRAVVSELRRRNYMGGVIEATVPGEATYRPEHP